MKPRQRPEGPAARPPPQPKPEPVERHKHHRIPDNLPCEYVHKEVPKEDRICKRCGSEMKKAGCDCKTLLEYVPAHFKKVVTLKRPLRVCQVRHFGGDGPCGPGHREGLAGSVVARARGGDEVPGPHPAQPDEEHLFEERCGHRHIVPVEREASAKPTGWGPWPRRCLRSINACGAR